MHGERSTVAVPAHGSGAFAAEVHARTILICNPVIPESFLIAAAAVIFLAFTCARYIAGGTGEAVQSARYAAILRWTWALVSSKYS